MITNTTKVTLWKECTKKYDMFQPLGREEMIILTLMEAKGDSR